MAIEKVIDIKVQGNADEAVGTLRQQLKAAVLEVQKLSEAYGENSKQAIEAAKRAAAIKDKIEDANDAVLAFKGEGAFLATSKALSSVASGFAAVQGAQALFGVQSKEVEATLLKVQSAMALSQGLAGLEDAGRSFKQLKAVAVDAFKGIKTAIGSTGIGLLVIALGTIYAYWDDIKEAVSGVSEEQKKLNAASQKNVDLEAEKLKAIGNQDNILKLQGKSEKEILDIKIKQTDEAIAANKINQQNQILNTKLAVQGAQRNYEMLKSYIDFVSIPTRFLYENAAKSINNIIDLLNKIPGVNIKGKLDEALGDKAADYIAKLGFDPEKVKEEGDKTVKASQETIDKLVNDRAGYQLSKQAIDKEAKDKLDASEQKNLDDAKAAAKKEAEELLKIQQEYAQKARDLQREEGYKAQDDVEAARKANADRLLSEQELAIQTENEAYKIKYDNAVKAGQDTEELEIQHLNNLNDIRLKSDAEDLKIKQDNAAATEEIEKRKQAARQQYLAAGANTLKQAASLLGESTDAGKAAAIAAATIETYQSAVSSYNSLSGIPIVGPALGAVAAGVAVASGIANVKKILSVKTPKGGGGGGGNVPSGGGAPSAPQFNVVGNSGVNQLAGIMATNEQTPVKAYVVPSDVTTGQSLDRNIIRNASLG
jgi:hypothetical protein